MDDTMSGLLGHQEEQLDDDDDDGAAEATPLMLSNGEELEEDLDLDSCDMAELVTRGACHTRLQCLESDRKITLGQMRLLAVPTKIRSENSRTLSQHPWE